MADLLEVDDLTLRLGGVSVLSGVTFSVQVGERLALAGPNGAGKTSILNCLAGVHPGHGGRIWMRGLDLAGVPVVARAGLGMARTFQHQGLVPDLDVRANLLLGRHHLMRAGWVASSLRLPRARDEEAAHWAECEPWAERVGVTAWLAMPAGRLPAGAQKRVELARSLAAGPELLLLDEPFAGVSSAEAEQMAAAIRASTAAIILIDHHIDLVRSLVDREVALDAGRMVAAG